jgi:NADPH:quinone reductase-like Zn-dependent oxidoreductase
MKAILVRSYGHSDLVHEEDIPTPTARPGEALVRVRAAGVNPVDWKTREGEMKDAYPRTFPLTLGQDFSGEIVALGSGITDLKIGDAVYGLGEGTFAEYAAVPLTMIARKPATLDFPAAAALPTPALTAFQVVLNYIRPKLGQTLLIHGAAGAVGSIATQLAVSKGARVIATASSRDAAYLKSLGVQEIIDFKTERFEQKVRDVDAVLDLVGGDVIARSVGVIRPGGALVTTVGPLPDSSQLGIRATRASFVLMKPNSRDLAQIAELVDRGLLKFRLSQVMPLKQAREAMDLSQSGSSHGKVILKVA